MLFIKSTSLQTCLRFNLCCFGLLNTSTPRVALLALGVVSTVSNFLNTWTCSGHFSDVSDSFLNSLTFVELVLVSFSPLCRSNLLLLMFIHPSFFSISTFISYRFQIRFCLAAFCTFVMAFLSVYCLAVPNLRTLQQS